MKSLFNNYGVKSERLLLAAVIGLFGLLIVLGWLQYSWLGEISRSERENLQNRLNNDSRRFVADFNNEIRGAYFIFQIDPGDWQKKDWANFNQRLELWKARTAYTNLIKDFYFVGVNSAPLKYDWQAGTFQPTERDADIEKIESKVEENKDGNSVSPVILDKYLLLSPVYDSAKQITIGEQGIPNIKMNFAGYSVIKLDEGVVGQILADLTQKYFPDDRFANYNLSISNNADQSQVFANKTRNQNISDETDVKIKLFDLASNQYRMFVNSRIFTPTSAPIVVPRASPDLPMPKIDQKDSAKIQIVNTKRPIEEMPPSVGEWTLNIAHRDGSLEKFIENARRKNLLVSFGILTLLGASMVVIFVAVRRAQILARRQLNFVSAVSHEFRTPVAVIHSAGENLCDGIVSSPEKIERYGNLIKNEAKKLSAMVEQILEYAGARAGKRKYVFRETNVAEIIDEALDECRPLLIKEGFLVETDIQQNLPAIQADKSAMICAVQNLIGNSIKYAGETKWIKVSAKNGGGQIKIVVRDHGIGISAKDTTKIFKPFYRAGEVVNAQIHGNGLGLSLVKQTVEAHQGKIKLASEPGKGSEFTIFLPQKEAPMRK